MYCDNWNFITQVELITHNFCFTHGLSIERVINAVWQFEINAYRVYLANYNTIKNKTPNST